MFGLIAAAAANHPSSRIRYMLKVSCPILSHSITSTLPILAIFLLAQPRLDTYHSTPLHCLPYRSMTWHNMTLHPDTFLHPYSAHTIRSPNAILYCLKYCYACCRDLENIYSHYTYIKSYISLFPSCPHHLCHKPLLCSAHEAVHSPLPFPPS